MITIYFIFLLVGGAYSFQAPRVSVSKPRSVIASPPQHLSPKFGLFSVSDSIDTNDSGAEIKPTIKSVSPEKIEGRKKRVKMGYKISCFGFAAFSAFVLKLSRNPFYAVGSFLASGYSYILLGAAENDRLSSDTYKRLNLAQITYSAMIIFSGFLMKSNLIFRMLCLVTLINSIKGYGYGLKGWELGSACAKEDMTKGMLATFKCVTNVNLKSIGYLGATILVGSLTVSKIAEFTNLLLNNSDKFMAGTRLYRAAKLVLLTVASLTLKDAADRDRLEGTTFIELNFLSLIALLSWALDSFNGTMSTLGYALSFSSAYFGFNGISSIMKKRSKA